MPVPPLPTNYDDVPYPSRPHPYSHPDHLAVVATLLGLSPARSDRSRILELGCAGGGNLIPLAYAYPQSTFVGVDLSVVQIRQAEELRNALDLENLELRAMSILDVDGPFGTFDFIICHGVYSWVSHAVQDKILGICARHLAPNGIGFVSYNTFPGWHTKGMIRAMMLLHERRYRDHPPQGRIDRSRALLAFLAKAVPTEMNIYRALLQEARDNLAERPDSYLFHEHLEEYNEPMYFLDFCERLEAKGLRYLGEAPFYLMVPNASCPQEVREGLQSMATNLLEMEQYMDLLCGRMFRQSLIGHAALRPDYEVRADRLASFHIASMVRPSMPNPVLASSQPEEFTAGQSVSLLTPIPIVKAALACLGESWPQPIAFEDLLSRARSRLSDRALINPADDARALGKALLTAYTRAGKSIVQFWIHPPPLSAEAGTRPTASRLARLQVASALTVTNLRHETIELSPLGGQLLRLVDGSRDRAELIELLLDICQKGKFSIPGIDHPVAEPSHLRGHLSDFIDRTLALWAQLALLTAENLSRKRGVREGEAPAEPVVAGCAARQEPRPPASGTDSESASS
jgi:methyltransferase-like protein/SAM-dependent methyltransferase